MIKAKAWVYFVPKKCVPVPTTAEQSAKNTVPRLLHHPVHEYESVYGALGLSAHLLASERHSRSNIMSARSERRSIELCYRDSV